MCGNLFNASCMHAQVNTDMTVELPCEDAARIASKLEAQAALGPLRILYDVAEVVEACGGTHVEVHLDCRQHKNESLLLLGLASHQGPAICVKLPGAWKVSASTRSQPGNSTCLFWNHSLPVLSEHPVDVTQAVCRSGSVSDVPSC